MLSDLQSARKGYLYLLRYEVFSYVPFPVNSDSIETRETFSSPTDNFYRNQKEEEEGRHKIDKTCD